VTLGSCTAQSQEITSPLLSVRVVADGYVFAGGRWTQAAGTDDDSLISGTNTVRVVCNRIEERCSETIAYINTEDVSTILDVLSFDYDVIEWSDNFINAIYHAPVADIELRIDLDKESAERHFRETGATGVLRFWTLS
jgi:hypothetical protein